MKRKSAFFSNADPKSVIDFVYGKGRRQQVEALTDCYPTIISAGNFDQHAAALGEVEVIFSSWGMPVLDPSHFQRLPALKAVFYAAGSVQYFARPLLERGVQVVSAWAANAIPVAEFTLAQILLGCKSYFQNCAAYRAPEQHAAATRGPGVFGETVALIGAGMIGRKLIELLKPFDLSVWVVDPYLSPGQAAQLGVRKASLEEAFAAAIVVSNHVPDLPSTKGLLTGALFASMRPAATFINTARGAQVVEADLIAVLKSRPDLAALLDVTDPEPVPVGSELYTLPNVRLSTHIAGSINDEGVRMADFIIAEYRAYDAGQPLQYSVSLEMLERMA